MKFLEIEFKYNAENVDFKAFEEFALSKKPLKSIIVSGFDHFYSHAKNPDSFCRHRIGPDLNQLTFKRKDPTANNNVTRTEHNINLATDTSKEQIEAFCKEFNYFYNTSIFKTCFVYTYEWYTLVYYIVHDTNMKEVGRFLEIEASESYAWGSKEEALSSIISIERFAKGLGLSAQSRLKKSLWEMFRKETK